MSAPTLVMHAREDEVVPFDSGVELAREIPGARFVALEGRNHLLLEGEPAWPEFVREMRSFLVDDNQTELVQSIPLPLA